MTPTSEDMLGMSSHLSAAGRVDMLTGPVAAARAVATGAWVKSKHMYLICLPIRQRIKKKKKKKHLSALFSP